MKMILFFVLVITNLPFFANGGELNNQGKILIMPQDLVELAEKNGYTQVDNFYSLRGDVGINPCFVYGHISNEDDSDALMKAVFLCRKIGEEDEWDSHMIISSIKYGNLTLDEIIDNVLLGGISIIKDTTATLDEFHYLSKYNLESGPIGVKLTNEIIRIDNNDGLADDYYKYEGKWLIRTWD